MKRKKICFNCGEEIMERDICIALDPGVYMHMSCRRNIEAEIEMLRIQATEAEAVDAIAKGVGHG